jgi:hypothetical protein
MSLLTLAPGETSISRIVSCIRQLVQYEQTMPAPLTASLVSDVALNNISTYFPGPSIAQGTVGTWYVSASATFRDTAAAALFELVISDGTTIIASGGTSSFAGGAFIHMCLSGVITSPANNLRITARDFTNTTGQMMATLTGFGHDTMITAFRIG